MPVLFFQYQFEHQHPGEGSDVLRSCALRLLDHDSLASVGSGESGSGLAVSSQLTTEFSLSRAARTSYACGLAVYDPMTACAAP